MHTEPTEEETRLFPPQFDSSTGLDQPSELSLAILCGFTRVSAGLRLSDVYRSSDVRVCLVDGSSGVCM